MGGCSFKTKARALVSGGLGISPLQTRRPGRAGLGAGCRLELGLPGARAPSAGTRHMEPRIHHRLGRRPGLEITPEGYILIRKLAAVFQSHRRNSPSCFIFSKPARPGSPLVSLVFRAVPMGTRHASPGRAGSLARRAPRWAEQGMGPPEKKNPRQVKHRNSCGLVSASQGCSGGRRGLRKSAESPPNGQRLFP